MQDAWQALSSYHSQIFHFLTITLLYVIVWRKSVEGTWLIDDDQGIAPYSERWIQEKDKNGNIVSERKVDSYKIDGKGRDIKFLSLIPELGIPGMFLRFFRLHVGKKWQVIGKNIKGHEVFGYVQSAFRHHVFSLVVQYLNLILSYLMVGKLFGWQTAFLTTLLFSVQPVSAQTICWISGINYLFSLLGILAVINTSLYIHSYYFSIPLTVFFSLIAGFTLIPGNLTFIILLFLGFYWEGFAAGLVSLAIAGKEIPSVVSYRVKAFKDQNMDKFTAVTPSRPILMVKTIFYYLSMIFLPIRLGLYHLWGYHFDENLSKPTGMFWGGLIFSSILGYLFYKFGFEVRFIILWFIVYISTFLNFITAQQFVADRYVFIPSLAVCLTISFLPEPIFYFILGLYAMRSFLHVWTFNNQIDLYLSNWLNFRESEVALGNLGCIYNQQGWTGSAIDAWKRATMINPFYDVPWYNLYSCFKTSGILGEAKAYLRKCLDSKTVHFDKKWKEEYEELCKKLSNASLTMK